MSSPEIGWWPAHRADELMAFIDQHWKRGHILSRDRELLCWQHRIPGDPQHLSVLTGSRDGHITGVLGVIRADAHLHGRRVTGAWLALWYVDPTAGEGPLGLRLMKTAFDQGFGFIGCTGMNDTALRLFRAFKFKVIDSMPRWILPEGTMPAAMPADGLEIAEWQSDWTARNAGEIGVWRDADYIDWRYVQHPRFQYRIRVARDGSVPCGLSVSRLEHVKDSTETVLRVVELTGTPKAMRALGADLTHAAHRHNVRFADFYCTRLECGAALEHSGFTRQNADSYPSLFQPLDPKPRPLNLAIWTAEPAVIDEQVYFTRSDGDQDRPS
ncbi:MAG: hypothetical protein SGI92_05455 [Bryobacteraceae bacterium]|nr:hypothetical protein [Bryobacteraceae bacterium]